MKSGKWEMYSVYPMQFENSIRFYWTKVLIQISRKASRKSDIDKIAFIQNHPNGHTFPEFIPSNTDIFREFLPN